MAREIPSFMKLVVTDTRPQTSGSVKDMVQRAEERDRQALQRLEERLDAEITPQQRKAINDSRDMNSGKNNFRG